MLGQALLHDEPSGKRILEFDDLRVQALRYFAGTTIVAALLLNAADLIANAAAGPISAAFVVALWLLLVAAITWWLVRNHVTIGASLLATGISASVVFLTTSTADNSSAPLLSLAVIVPAAVVGPRHGFLWASLTSAIAILLTYTGGNESWSPVLLLILIWGTALGAWLGSRLAYVAADWAWSSYDEAFRLTQELRIRQGELSRLTKSLNEAYYRLEQQNAVLEHAREAAEEARRLKSEFAASISHELRTPINLIVGVSEMMAESAADVTADNLPASYREDLDVISRNANHISHLIDDILDLSQVDAHRMALDKSNVSLADIVDQAVSIVASQFARKGLYLRVQVPSDLPMVHVDPVRLRQVLMNLLSNATRFTDAGGVTITAQEQDREIVVDVADTGAGIPMGEIASVFGEFRQAGPMAARRGGTGLGLAVSKRIVELHGGNMWARSTPESGSTFSFSLPLVDAISASPTSTDIEVAARSLAKRTRTLAVVGTDEQAASVIQRYIDDYQVVALDSESEARTLAQDGNLDAILITAKQPSERTPVVLDEIRGIPIIYTSMRTRRAVSEEIGVDEYLVKPVVKEQLLAAISRVRRWPRRVLVVEDDQDMRQMLARMIHSSLHPVEVVESAGGRDGLRLAQAFRPEVILLDLLMPEVDGYQFIERARLDRRLRRTPIIAISARGYEAESVVASELVLTRAKQSLSVGELTAAIRAVLDVMISSPHVGLPTTRQHISPAHQEARSSSPAC